MTIYKFTQKHPSANIKMGGLVALRKAKSDMTPDEFDELLTAMLGVYLITVPEYHDLLTIE